MFSSHCVLLALAGVALLAGSARAECLPVVEAEAQFNQDALLAGSFPAICVPGSDTEHPGQVKLDKLPGLLELAQMQGVIKIGATYTPPGVDGGSDIPLTCELPQSIVLELISNSADLDFTSLTLSCIGNGDNVVYFSMANRVLTGPPPESAKLRVTKDVSQANTR